MNLARPSALVAATALAAGVATVSMVAPASAAEVYGDRTTHVATLKFSEDERSTVGDVWGNLGGEVDDICDAVIGDANYFFQDVGESLRLTRSSCETAAYNCATQVTANMSVVVRPDGTYYCSTYEWL